MLAVALPGTLIAMMMARMARVSARYELGPAAAAQDERRPLATRRQHIAVGHQQAHEERHQHEAE